VPDHIDSHLGSHTGSHLGSHIAGDEPMSMEVPHPDRSSGSVNRSPQHRAEILEHGPRPYGSLMSTTSATNDYPDQMARFSNFSTTRTSGVDIPGDPAQMRFVPSPRASMQGKNFAEFFFLQKNLPKFSSGFPPCVKLD
jgi:hypothetical protein